MPYRTLKADCVIETINALALRIGERFPDSGLRQVCLELGEVARGCAGEAERLSRPNLFIRTPVYLVWATGALVLALIASGLDYHGFSLEAAKFVQILEPAMNLAVLVGIGVLGLGRLEMRWKRARAINMLNALRSIAHVVDMHQLTKDPYRRGRVLQPTPHSPPAGLEGPLLERYFSYCSEMLSLAGKLAALLAQCVCDPEVADVASDIEDLTTGLSRKIWQKITLIPQ
ncbi:MAG TPA: hypothetical protein VNH64_09625 [Parvularculaceae bacterium]|nr:hypothetical protein [Parvularculaceae bacterium]